MQPGPPPPCGSLPLDTHRQTSRRGNLTLLATASDRDSIAHLVLRAPRSALLTAALALACAALTACAQDLASPFSAVVVQYDASKQSYALAQVRVGTLTSLRHLQGSAGTVRAGGTVRVASATLRDPAATVDSLRARFVTAAPSDVDLSFNIANDLVYPEDYNSLELLTAYFNVEQARLKFTAWGGSPLQPALMVAHANIQDENGLNPVGDGELFYPPLGNWYLPASSDLAQLPLVFNLGAVAHALTHQAIAQIVWGGKPLPPAEVQTGKDAATLTARHVARSMTEGLADFFGVAVSSDPSWFNHSVQQTAAGRTLDQIRCSRADMLDALAVDDAQVPYNPYPLGSVIAGALWQVAQLDVPHFSPGVFAALPVMSHSAANNQGRLGLADVLDALAGSALAEYQPALCGLFLNRFRAVGITAANLPSCSGAATPPTDTCQ